MKNFNATTKLKQATCAFIASQLLLKQEKEEIDEVFRALDTNSDGKLSKDEVRNGYFDYYGRDLSDDEIDKMFTQINHSGSGAISYSEFVVAAMFEKNMLDNSKLQAAFAMFDSDGDGHISVDNFKQVLHFFKDEADGDDDADEYILEKIIKQVDSDGDGKISYEDFQEMMFKTVAVADPIAPAPVPATNAVPVQMPPRRKKGHNRQKSAILEVKAAEAYMSLFAEAVANGDQPKRHRRNLSHLSHFANQESLAAVGAQPPTHKKDSKSMCVLPSMEE